MRHFGNLSNGTAAQLFTLRSKYLEVVITNYGGRVVSLLAPSRDGKMDDVALGFESLDAYRNDRAYHGALIGRYAGRIAGGRLSVAGASHQLTQNEGGNTLHGGHEGFDRQLWQASATASGLDLTYRSRDGEEGFPGNLRVMVRYRVIRNALRIDYHATTDRDTVINLTSHIYFNLSSNCTDHILDHTIKLHADRYLPVNAEGIPTGALHMVTGTAFDFRRASPIGAGRGGTDEQLRLRGGYDHTWVLGEPKVKPALAAEVSEPTTGRVMAVFTTEPGVHFYSGNQLDGEAVGKFGRSYGTHAGFCMETQHFSDSPHHPQFPTTILRPGRPHRSTTIYRFGTDARQ